MVLSISDDEKLFCFFVVVSDFLSSFCYVVLSFLSFNLLFRFHNATIALAMEKPSSLGEGLGEVNGTDFG